MKTLIDDNKYLTVTTDDDIGTISYYKFSLVYYCIKYTEESIYIRIEGFDHIILDYWDFKGDYQSFDDMVQDFLLKLKFEDEDIVPPVPEQTLQYLGESYVADSGVTYLEDKSVQGGEVQSVKGIGVGDKVSIKIPINEITIDYDFILYIKISSTDTSSNAMILGGSSWGGRGMLVYNSGITGRLVLYVSTFEYVYWNNITIDSCLVIEKSNNSFFLNGIASDVNTIVTFRTTINTLMNRDAGDLGIVGDFGCISLINKSTNSLVFNFSFTETYGDKVIETISGQVLQVEGTTDDFHQTIPLESPELIENHSVLIPKTSIRVPYDNEGNPILPEWSTAPDTDYEFIGEFPNKEKAVQKYRSVGSARGDNSISVEETITNGDFIEFNVNISTLVVTENEDVCGTASRLYSYLRLRKDSDTQLRLVGETFTNGDYFEVDVFEFLNAEWNTFRIGFENDSVIVRCNGATVLTKAVINPNLLIGDLLRGYYGYFANLDYRQFTIKKAGEIILDIDFTESEGKYVFNKATNEKLLVNGTTEDFFKQIELEEAEVIPPYTLWSKNYNEFHAPFKQDGTPSLGEGSTIELSGEDYKWLSDYRNPVQKGLATRSERTGLYLNGTNSIPFDEITLLTSEVWEIELSASNTRVQNYDCFFGALNTENPTRFQHYTTGFLLYSTSNAISATSNRPDFDVQSYKITSDGTGMIYLVSSYGLDIYQDLGLNDSFIFGQISGWGGGSNRKMQGEFCKFKVTKAGTPLIDLDFIEGGISQGVYDKVSKTFLPISGTLNLGQEDSVWQTVQYDEVIPDSDTWVKEGAPDINVPKAIDGTAIKDSYATPPEEGYTWSKDFVNFYQDRYDNKLGGSFVGKFNGENYVTIPTVTLGVGDYIEWYGSLTGEDYSGIIGNGAYFSYIRFGLLVGQVLMNIKGETDTNSDNINIDFIETLFADKRYKFKFGFVEVDGLFYAEMYINDVFQGRDSVINPNLTISRICDSSASYKYKGTIEQFNIKTASQEINIPFSIGSGNKVYDTINHTEYTIEGDLGEGSDDPFWQKSTFAFDRNRQLGFSKNVLTEERKRNNDFIDGLAYWNSRDCSVIVGEFFDKPNVLEATVTNESTIYAYNDDNVDVNYEDDYIFEVEYYLPALLSSGLKLLAGFDLDNSITLDVVGEWAKAKFTTKFSGNLQVYLYAISGVVGTKFYINYISVRKMSDEGVYIPASTTNPTQDIFGNELTNKGVTEGLNGSENTMLYPDKPAIREVAAKLSENIMFNEDGTQHEVTYDEIYFDRDSLLFADVKDNHKKSFLTYASKQQANLYNDIIDWENMHDQVVWYDVEGVLMLDPNGEYRTEPIEQEDE